MRVAWATDIHLNFCDEPTVLDFCARVVGSDSDALLLGGDIAEAADLRDWLLFLAEHLERPAYFVLGNHDYYGSDVAAVRRQACELPSPCLRWLPGHGTVELTESSALVGHGGWGDARLGNPSLPVLLSDYLLIRDLREVGGANNPLGVIESTDALRSELHRLGDDAAATLRPHLWDAASRFATVFVLTHVPPFRESCWHQGRISDEDWLPGFTCKAMGDLLLEVASARPACRLIVLCGHTHGEGEARPLPNLVVYTQAARYGRPDFRTIEIPD